MVARTLRIIERGDMHLEACWFAADFGGGSINLPVQYSSAENLCI